MIQALSKSITTDGNRLPELRATGENPGTCRSSNRTQPEPLADAAVEPAEAVESTADDTLAQGLRATDNVRPLHERTTRKETEHHTDPMQQHETGYEGGYEDDGRAV